MAKLASIKHYRQTGVNATPSTLPYSEIAVSKDGEMFVGNENNIPIKVGCVNLTHTKTGTVHNLTGLGGSTGKVSCIFCATADYVEGDTILIDNVYYSIITSNGVALDDYAFVSGAEICIIVDVVGKRVNFKSGGGKRTPSIFGDGSDGHLVIKAGETVTLPVEHPHKDIIIKQYKSILIETGGTLTTSAPNCGLVLRCKGNCIVDGTIDQSGKGGFTNYDINYQYPTIMCGSGGNGGNGGLCASGDPGKGFNYWPKPTPSGVGMVGKSYGGGFGGCGSGGYGGFIQIYYSQGASTSGGSAGKSPQATQDNSFISIGGTGGSGSINGSDNIAGRGGIGAGNVENYGGGLLLLYVGGDLTIRGSIVCNGVAAPNGGRGEDFEIANVGYYTMTSGGAGGGGAGGSGGGAIQIVYNAGYLRTGSLLVNGGIGGYGGGPGWGRSFNSTTAGSSGVQSGSQGNAGVIGQIKTIKYEKGMTGI